MPVDPDSITYTEAERQLVVDLWNSRKENPPSLVELVIALSVGECDDPREMPWGYKLKKIIKDVKIRPKTQAHEKVPEVVLTEDQKIFVRNHIKENSAYEIAKILFPRADGKRLEPLGREVNAINKYLKDIGEYVVKKGEETPVNDDDKYTPPKTFHAILAKVNEYLHEDLSTQNITAFEKGCLETTIDFLHSPRFIQEINNYKTVEKRITFESEFIRAVYHKPDLTPEEVSLTINWCSDIIEVADSKKQAEKLKAIMDLKSDDQDGKFTMSLVEAIGEINKHINEVLKRQKDIYIVLNKKRSERKSENDNKVGSLTALFEWATEEENRKKMLEKAEMQKELRKAETRRMESLDDLILLSLGMSTSQAVN